MMRPFPSASEFALPPRSKFARPLVGVCIILAALSVVFVLLYSFVFGPAAESSLASEEFIVHPEDTFGDIARALGDADLVKHEWAFKIAAMMTHNGEKIRPGGYLITRSMDAFTVVDTLSQAPYLAWIVIPQSARKEEVVAVLSRELHWDQEEEAVWASANSILPEFSEGVYFADTYLIPSDLSPGAVAELLRSRFAEATVNYMLQAEEAGKDWNDVLTLASLIEREAARNDKALVAGILEKRLSLGMPLQVDATLQYVSATAETGWWTAPDPADKEVDSPFNTYIYEGLPPAPIATPTAASIEAALDPESTSCLYYLHDSRGRIHCSSTYAQHKANINLYLR